jgi:hypothetical protein
MAKLESEFIAETLSSRQLLALLFVCECQRKKILDEKFETGANPIVWSEFLDRFAARLEKLPESERVYLLGSHLQSSEELDIYCNAEVKTLLEMHGPLLATLTHKLDKDPCFA